MRKVIALCTLFTFFHSDPTFCQCKDDSKGKFQASDFRTQFPDEIRPIVESIPKDFEKQFLSKCSTDKEYVKSMQNLESVVAEVAISDKIVEDAMEKLNLSFLRLIEKTVEFRLKFEGSVPTQNEISKKVDELLVKYYGSCKGLTPGCVGSDPTDIRKAFQNGNLRERFYLAWDPAENILKNEIIYSCKEGEFCFCKTIADNRRDNWKQFEHVKNGILNACDAVRAEGKDLFKRGRFAGTNSFFRAKRSPEEVLEVSRLSEFSLDDGMTEIPFSEREKRYLEKNGEKVDFKVKLATGMAIFKPKPLDSSPESPDPENLYYSTAEKSAFPVGVAISGTTDSLLNLACILGSSSDSQLENLRVAAMGYMVPSRHHTAYEIMVASKSFKNMSADLNSDYYKTLLPSNSGFSKKVEKTYSDRYGYNNLPTKIYKRCLNNAVEQINNAKVAQCRKEAIGSFSKSSEELLKECSKIIQKTAPEIQVH